MHPFIAIALIISHLTLFSCSNKRNPNLSEKQLLALLNDTTRKPVETTMSMLADTSYVPPMGAKYTEIRSVDPASPPITLKVSIPEGAKQPLKLSWLGSSVEYIILKLPDENDFFLSQTGVRRIFEQASTSNRQSTRVNMLGDHFITTDVQGIRLFDPSGNFVQNILMSEFDGQRNARQIEINHNENFKGAYMRDVSDTRIFLSFVDYGAGKTWAGEFNLANMPLYSSQSEMTSSVPGLEMVPVRRAPTGRSIDDGSLFNFRGGGEHIAITFSIKGDTLSKFANHVRLEEGQSSGPANSDIPFSYRSQGELFFRQTYCDTIFRVQSANRIVPAYRFDFGERRVSLYEGTNSITQGKLLPWRWFAFKNSMLLIFTEGRDCPNCRTRGEVTFYALLYDKRSGRSTAIDLKSQYPENALIENDIDGGLPVPLNSLNIADNAIIAKFTKDQMQEILKNNARNIPAETAAKLKSMADALKSNEMLVMKINH